MLPPEADYLGTRIPVVNEEPDDVDAEFEALLAEPAEGGFTAAQEDIIASSRNPVLVAPKSDRSVSGGVPFKTAADGSVRHDAPDDIAGVVVRVDPLDFAGGVTAEYTVSGMNDPVVREVAARYAGQTGPQAAAAAMAEIAAIKRAQARPARAGGRAPRGAAPPAAQAAPAKPPVGVVFDLGDSVLYGSYSDVLIQGGTLVLVVDRAALAGGEVKVPKPADPPRPLTARVEGLDAPVRAYPTGLSFTHGGTLYCLMAIDRPAE